MLYQNAPPVLNAVLGVPVVVPAAALDVVAEAPAIPMEIEEPEVVEVAPITVEDYNWKPKVNTSKRLLRRRHALLKNTKWCPLCNEICMIKKKPVNGHTASSRKNRGTNYPDCPDKGKISREDVKKWTNKFKVGRQIKKIETLLQKPKKKK
jgi:hypothetical protein